MERRAIATGTLAGRYGIHAVACLCEVIRIPVDARFATCRPRLTAAHRTRQSSGPSWPAPGSPRDVESKALGRKTLCRGGSFVVGECLRSASFGRSLHSTHRHKTAIAKSAGAEDSATPECLFFSGMPCPRCGREWIALSAVS